MSTGVFDCPCPLTLSLQRVFGLGSRGVKVPSQAAASDHF